MAEFSQGLTEKIMKEIPQTEATEVYVSESGVQGKVTEMVRTFKTIYPLYSHYFYILLTVALFFIKIIERFKF